MRCCFGHCQTVFHPLCCRRAACHMRAVDHSKKRFTAFCEKHSRSEREKDLAVNLTGDPVPALVEMYNQSPLERQLSGGLQRTLSGGTTGVSPMNGAMRRIRETMRAKDTQKRAAFGGLPSSAKAKTKKTRSNLQQANRLPGSVPGSSLAGFDSEENFDDLLPGQRGQARNTGALRGGALPRDALLTSPEADMSIPTCPPGTSTWKNPTSHDNRTWFTIHDASERLSPRSRRKHCIRDPLGCGVATLQKRSSLRRPPHTSAFARRCVAKPRVGTRYRRSPARPRVIIGTSARTRREPSA